MKLRLYYATAILLLGVMGLPAIPARAMQPASNDARPAQDAADPTESRQQNVPAQPDNTDRDNADLNKHIAVALAGRQANLDLISSFTAEIESRRRVPDFQRNRSRQNDDTFYFRETATLNKIWSAGDRSRVSSYSLDGDKPKHRFDMFFDGKDTHFFDAPTRTTSIKPGMTGPNAQSIMGFGYLIARLQFDDIVPNASWAELKSPNELAFEFKDGDGYSYRFTVDPSRGFLVTETEGRAPNGTVSFRRSDIRLQSAPNGAWMMAAATDEFFDLEGQRTVFYQYNANRLAINEPIAESDFTLPRPPGSPIINTMTGSREVVPEDTELPAESPDSPDTWLWVAISLGGVVAAVVLYLARRAVGHRRIANPQ